MTQQEQALKDFDFCLFKLNTNLQSIKIHAANGAAVHLSHFVKLEECMAELRRIHAILKVHNEQTGEGPEEGSKLVDGERPQ